MHHQWLFSRYRSHCFVRPNLPSVTFGQTCHQGVLKMSRSHTVSAHQFCWKQWGPPLFSLSQLPLLEWGCCLVISDQWPVVRIVLSFGSSQWPSFVVRVVSCTPCSCLSFAFVANCIVGLVVFCCLAFFTETSQALQTEQAHLCGMLQATRMRPLLLLPVDTPPEPSILVDALMPRHPDPVKPTAMGLCSVFKTLATT